MCDRNYSWRKDLKWNLKWNHSVHSKANSNVIIALFSTFGGLILLFLIWLYYEHRKSANITENCRRLGKSLPNHGYRDRKPEPVHRSNQKNWTIKSGPLVWDTMFLNYLLSSLSHRTETCFAGGLELNQFQFILKLRI